MFVKKSSISAVFVYAVSAIIIILVVYFGYRAITGFANANDQSIMDRMQLRMKADMSQLSLRYGTQATLSYDITSKFNKMCFVDLSVAGDDASARDSSLENYSIILDSVQSNSSNNVFVLGESTIPFAVGKMKLRCPPFYLCVNSSHGRITFLAEGGGDSVIINNGNCP